MQQVHIMMFFLDLATQSVVYGPKDLTSLGRISEVQNYRAHHAHSVQNCILSGSPDKASAHKSCEALLYYTHRINVPLRRHTEQNSIQDVGRRVLRLFLHVCEGLQGQSNWMWGSRTEQR